MSGIDKEKMRNPFLSFWLPKEDERLAFDRMRTRAAVSARMILTPKDANSSAASGTAVGDMNFSLDKKKKVG